MSKTLYVRPSHQYHSDPTTSGKVQLTITPFALGDPVFQKPDGSGNLGMSVAQLKALFGGDEGQIVDPIKGLTHPISLKPWEKADPNRTFLHFTFRFMADKAAKSIYDDTNG